MDVGDAEMLFKILGELQFSERWHLVGVSRNTGTLTVMEAMKKKVDKK